MILRKWKECLIQRGKGQEYEKEMQECQQKSNTVGTVARVNDEAGLTEEIRLEGRWAQ